MTNLFDGLVSTLTNVGFFGYLLPFIFIFAASYGILKKTKTLGDDEKIIGIVSLVIGFMTMAFGGTVLQNVFVGFSGTLSILVLGALTLVIFVSVLGGDASSILGNEVVKVGAILVGIGALAFVSESRFRINIFNNSSLLSIIVIVVVGGIVYYIIKN